MTQRTHQTHHRFRARVKQLVREYFRDYLEVDTPVVVPCPGVEPYLQYFPTTWRDHNGDSWPLWLRSSPELHMKQLLSATCRKIYQLGPCFRNFGERAAWHHPEFWMLEWYVFPCHYHDLIQDHEDFICYLWRELASHRQGPSLPRPTARVQRWSVYECFEEFVKVKLIDRDPELPAKLQHAGIPSITATDDFESAFFKALLDRIEPQFAKHFAVLLYDYPPSQAVLSQIHPHHSSSLEPRAQRVECYLKGIEVTNGCMELVDVKEYRRRWQAIRKQRLQLNSPCPEPGPDFERALSRLPANIAGTACGFDRLVAILKGDHSLDHTVAFRHHIYRHPSP